jgi:hypothetical protein
MIYFLCSVVFLLMHAHVLMKYMLIFVMLLTFEFNFLMIFLHAAEGHSFRCSNTITSIAFLKALR